MPRLNDDFLECAFYLYRSKHEAEEGIQIGGSGFLVTVPAERAGGSFIYAVTNRHVIEAGAKVIRMNTTKGGTAIDDLEGWISSPTDDLAIHPVSFSSDDFAQKGVPVEIILTEERAAKMRIGIGDAVFMVGRFVNHEGKQRNAPLVRFGMIAQMPTEPIEYELNGKPHSQDSIIADIRSIGGYSGSPVFLNEQNIFDRAGGAPIDRHYLIGIDWGHIKMWSPVCGPDEEPIINTQVNINSGMAGIVPSWKLLDLIMSDDLKHFRKKTEDQQLAAGANR
jgi:hypothetical protein